MGSDDLFRKRKPKTGRDFKRRSPKRAPYDKVLIVCEGSKTEPNYFNELRDYSTLETANVRVASSCGSDPMSVVRHGKNLYRDEKQKGHPYDRVYCVFEAMSLVENSRRPLQPYVTQCRARPFLLSRRYLVLNTGFYCISLIPRRSLVPWAVLVQAMLRKRN